MTTFLPHPVPKHLSYSQATTLADCGERYRLERIFRVPTPPSWAAVGGKAMHLASEWIDRLDVSETNFVQWLTWQYLPMVDSSQTESPGPDQSGIARAAALKVDETHAVTKSALEDGLRAVKDLGLAGPEWSLENVPDSVSALWRHAFSEEIQNEVRHADTQYQDTSTWKVFGRATKFWPDKENRAWWDHHGPIFLIRWINFRATSGWDLILLDDDPEQPAIEIDCSGLIGDVALKGFIDRLFLDERGQPFILDLKGLDVRTPLATPTGWTTMGEVEVGDQVFGANGSPVTVVAKSEVKQLPCFRVKFDDGTDIVCDEEHLWETTTGQGKGKTTSVKGIKEIASRLQPRPGAQRDQRIRMPDPVQLPEADLPIDPYLLGVWLGDGAAQSGKYTKPEEYKIQDVLRERGHDVYRATCPSLEDKCPLWMVRNLTRSLRLLGVQNNKHIPQAYLRGSVQQRMDLVRGLMDSDGTWNKKRNQATFSSVDKEMAHAMRELVLTLGERASMFEVNGHGFGKQVTYYAVSWSPRVFVPFYSPVKADRVVFAKGQGKSTRRLITAVEEVPSTPTVCIAVDAEDHLFLAGEQMVPTHNTNGKLPTERKQLGVYRVLLGKMGFPPPKKGIYWWARSGELGPPLTISDFTEPELAWEFSGLQDLRNSGFLRANTKSVTCSYCGVKPYCRAQDGDLAHLIPKPWETPRPEIKSN